MNNWKVGTDQAEFSCVYQGQHWRLMSLSEHLKRKVPSDKFLLVHQTEISGDRIYGYRSVLAPKSEVFVQHRIK